MYNFWFKFKKPIIALAPMAGYTDSAFRLLCHQMGADIVYSEMISVDAICYNNQKTLKMFKYHPKEKPIVFQLFGNKVDKFKQAISQLPVKGKNIGIDINSGCPAHKVYKTGSGAALMNELDKAYNIIQTVCQNTDLPISVKIRTKVKDTTAIDFIKKIKDLPISAIMIHGRTLNQGFAGEIDYKIIHQAKQLLPNKIVLANGGINSQKDIAEVLEKTQADGLGVARGALGNPWIFKKKSNPTKRNRKKIIIKHAKLFLKDNYSLTPLRQHLVHYIKGQKNASAIRQRLIHVENLNELKKILKDF